VRPVGDRQDRPLDGFLLRHRDSSSSQAITIISATLAGLGTRDITPPG
jgi:hypothetical protein